MKKKDEINAFLGKNTALDGKLSFTGSVRVDGQFKGEISGDGSLIVGDSAKVEADVRVSYLIISGEIRGSLSAGEKIEIHAPGKVFGNIEAPVVVMEEGVVFDGHCRMPGGEKLEHGSEENQT
ncbi:MAG: polymer-forming cytoskeletal protein [Deltaproteobacteria bacterium]|nr:polymer-forming cytoskeletal protein [Deltaproteobacteria bacterium]